MLRKIKNFLENANIIAFIFASVILMNACTKEEQTETTVKNPKKENIDGIRYVPFFELAKGDTVGHDVFREKPVRKANEPVVQILYGTASNKKATGYTSSTGYIYDLKVSSRICRR